MRRPDQQHGRYRRGRPGQMMMVFALTLTVFVGAMMLGIDLSSLRATSENAQRAANAAALAGVVYLPTYQSSAYARALTVAAQNGFSVSSTTGVSVTTAIPDGYNNRLKVTVSEPVSLPFAAALGLGPQRISRSATAEYAQPLEMGASDYVLGYAPFPTTMVTQTAGITPTTQGFYLIARGPYGQQENGDAYSQYFEGYRNTAYSGNKSFVPSGTSNTGDTDPCMPDGTSCAGLTPNPDRKAVGFTRYDFVVDNPFTETLILKIFDPYDETPFNSAASKYKPQIQPIIDPFHDEFIDQPTCDGGGTNFCPTSGYTPTALQFQVDGPYSSTNDTTPRPVVPVTATASTAVAASVPMSLPTTMTGTGLQCSGDCVLSNTSNGAFVAGDDPTHTDCAYTHVTYSSCSKAFSPYAYKFLNYAIIHQGIYHVYVSAVANPNIPGSAYGGQYGADGNVFGLAACGVDNTYSPAVLGNATSPAGISGNVAVTDPASPAASMTAWNANSCPNPNDASKYPGVGIPAVCSHPGTAPQDSCVHIYAVNRMAIINILTAPSSGSAGAPSLIPLGYVPAAYAGKTLQVRLYDVGDIGGPSNNSVQVLTPAGDLTHNTTVSGGLSTNTPTGSSTAFPSILPYQWSAAPTDCDNPGTSCSNVTSSGYITVGSTSVPNGAPLGNLGLGSGKYNGSWVTMNIKIPNPTSSGTANGYDSMVNYFGGYWKMLYYLGTGSSGNDTTTWEINVLGSPVHLITG